MCFSYCLGNTEIQLELFPEITDTKRKVCLNPKKLPAKIKQNLQDLSVIQNYWKYIFSQSEQGFSSFSGESVNIDGR